VLLRPKSIKSTTTKKLDEIGTIQRK